MFKYFLASILSISVLAVQAEKAVDSDALGLMLSSKSTMEVKDCNIFEKNSQGKKVRSQKQIPCIMNNPSSGYPEAYQLHMKAYPDTRGEINYTFDINPMGRVSNVSMVNSTLTSKAAESTSEIEKRLEYIISFAVYPEFKGETWHGKWKVNF